MLLINPKGAALTSGIGRSNVSMLRHPKAAARFETSLHYATSPSMPARPVAYTYHTRARQSRQAAVWEAAGASEAPAGLCTDGLADDTHRAATIEARAAGRFSCYVG
jgi:hypothetical protein